MWAIVQSVKWERRLFNESCRTVPHPKHLNLKIWKLSQCQVQYHLNTGRDGQVWYLNGPNKSGCHMVWILSGGLKTRQQCLFYGLKCLVFKWFN